VPCPRSSEGAALPNSTRLEIGRGARKDGCGYAITWLASVHDTLGDGGEVAASTLALSLSEPKFQDDARGPVVHSDVVVWLMPHALGRTFLPDLGRIAVELDGGRILGGRLVAVGGGLVGRVCAVCRGHGPGRGGPQGRREESRSDCPR
jgi:hypothetical protein